MTVQQPGAAMLEAEMDQPLIGIVFNDNGHEVMRYFTSEEEADAAVPSKSIQRALDLAGAWSDLDWDEMEAALYRIGHESTPTPPIEDL